MANETKPPRLRPRPFKADPDKVLAALKRKLNDREEWDELPELGFIYAEGPGRVRTSALNVPDGMWQAAGDPKNVLRGLLQLLKEPPNSDAAAMAEGLRTLMPLEFVGIYMRVEGWGPPEGIALELHRRRQAGGSMPRFETMKGRREFRMGTAVDAEGMTYLAQQGRDTMQLEGFYSGGGPSDQDGRVGGAMPELLNDLLFGLLQMTPEEEAEYKRNGL